MAAPKSIPGPDTVNALTLALSYLRDGVLSIDAEGRIWRHKFITHGYLKDTEPRRAENVSGKGYLKVNLQLPTGKLGSVMAHRLIWVWLNGPIPEEIQINHKDLNKMNNRPDNLELVTGSGNIRHSYANGRPNPWYKATVWRGKPRVTNEQEAEIRALRATGLYYRELAERFSLSLTHVQRICMKGGEE